MENTNEFQFDGTVLTKYTGPGGKVTIPEGVTSIGSYAFSKCSNLTSVTIPEGVTFIGYGVFSECRSLTSVSIPKGVTSIGSYVFCACKSLISVSIPEGVTSIGSNAFSGCSRLTSVSIPEGVTYIGEKAFYECSSLTSVSIPEGVTYISDRAFSNCSSLTSVTIPKGVTSIGKEAFHGCSSLTSVSIPEGVTSIGEKAFYGCSSLISVSIPASIKTIGDYVIRDCTQLSELTIANPKLKLPKNTFGGWAFPAGLLGQIDKILPHMNDTMVKEVLFYSEAFIQMPPDAQARVMLQKQGEYYLNTYREMKITRPGHFPQPFSMNWEKIGEAILAHIHEKYTAKECDAVATLMIELHRHFSDAHLQAMYAALTPLKNAKKAKEAIAGCGALMNKLKLEVKIEDSLTGFSRKAAEQMVAAGKIRKEVETDLANYFGLAPKNLPCLNDAAGEALDPIVLSWLLTAHGTDGSDAFREPGIKPEVAELVAELDSEQFRDVLRELARRAQQGESPLRNLDYPLFRYADETLLVELLRIAPYLKDSYALCGSTSRLALTMAIRNGWLERYAEMRNTTPKALSVQVLAEMGFEGSDIDDKTLRDLVLSDVGLDTNGSKTYDLGNQTVVVRLQNDLSFLVELPTGKTAKSLPKKGADPALYSVANAAFSDLKKEVKQILKKRYDSLFSEFLSGSARSAGGWKAMYLSNALLRQAATLVVWVQNGNTFTVSGTGTICADGSEYVLTDAEIALAHPMEMTAEERKVWQKYLTARGLKQPFEQVWEPVIDPATISKGRYKGCMIPYYRLKGKEKHGIYASYDFSESYTEFRFDDCNVKVDTIDWHRHAIQMNDRYEITSFGFRKYTRNTNHIVAYLDKITIYDRIAKDDVTVADRLDSFTLAQITEFLRIAQENNAVNVTTLLLEHKNTHFADFDPMDEFTLDW